LAADLIMNGGHEADISNLLRAASGHLIYLQFPRRDDWRDERIANDLPDWLEQISRHWPMKNESQHQPPKTASELARANIRANLRRSFECFLGFSKLHDLYLLEHILQEVDGRSRGVCDEAAESILAEAFMQVLDSDNTYVKVPAGDIEAVEEFLKTLSEGAYLKPEPIGRPKLVAFQPRQNTEATTHA